MAVHARTSLCTAAALLLIAAAAPRVWAQECPGSPAAPVRAKCKLAVSTGFDCKIVLAEVTVR